MASLKSYFSAAVFSGMMILFCTPKAWAEGEVNVYSYRQPELIQPLLDAFTKETGIETNVLFLDKGLVERIQAEGVNSPADVLLTVDIARLVEAKEGGVTQPVLNDPVIEKDIPANLRDPEGEWFGLTTRGRVVYASKERVSQTSFRFRNCSATLAASFMRPISTKIATCTLA